MGLSLGMTAAAVGIFCVVMAGACSPAAALEPAPVAADAVGSSLGRTFSLGMVIGVVLGASYCSYMSREAIKSFLYPKFGWSTQSESAEVQSESSEVHTEATAKTNTTDPPKTAEDEEFSILVVISVVVGVMVVILVALYFFFAKTKSDEEDDLDELPDLENPPIRRDSLQQAPRRHEEIVAQLEGTSMLPPELAKHPLSRFKRMRQRID